MNPLHVLSVAATAVACFAFGVLVQAPVLALESRGVAVTLHLAPKYDATTHTCAVKAGYLAVVPRR